MREIFSFIFRYSQWLLFAVFTAVSCLLLFSSNPFQHYVFLTSAGGVASSVYRTTNSITGYFALREINDDLQRRNAELERELLGLKAELQERNLRIYADTMKVDTVLSRYSFILANVINNSVNRPYNYITLDKGSADGLKPEMGVVDHNGVVGIVNVTGPHTARVMSLLNPYQPLSCKVKGSEYVGSLQWDGKDYRTAVLEELPRHVVIHKGDTIVTSGFSSAFPQGVPVGTVLSSKTDKSDNFYSIRVKLFTDFSTLSTVRVIVDSLTDELKVVEKDISQPKTKMQ
nr:rod shape-determining protein MreC [Bacteroides sp.]